MHKYKQNLRVEGDRVYSYNTHVATISGGKLLIHGYWSVTTSKHVNYVAREYGLERVKAPREKETEKENPLRSIAMVAAFGEIFGTTKKEKNDWKARMLKAGLGGRGLSMPEDWDTLTEEEKERRLNGAIEAIK